MITNDFIIGNGNHANVAQRILWECTKQKYTPKQSGDFAKIVLYNLAQGWLVEDAITDAKFLLIKGIEQTTESVNIAKLDSFFKTICITITITLIIAGCLL